MIFWVSTAVARVRVCVCVCVCVSGCIDGLVIRVRYALASCKTYRLNLIYNYNLYWCLKINNSILTVNNIIICVKCTIYNTAVLVETGHPSCLENIPQSRGRGGIPSIHSTHSSNRRKARALPANPARHQPTPRVHITGRRESARALVASCSTYSRVRFRVEHVTARDPHPPRYTLRATATVRSSDRRKHPTNDRGGGCCLAVNYVRPSRVSMSRMFSRRRWGGGRRESLACGFRRVRRVLG